MRHVLSLSVLLLSLGCARSDTPDAASTPFVIDPTPVFDIGVSEGDPRFEFNRVFGMRRLPDGRVVVADGSSRELRWFAAEGSYLQSAGRRGNGPGEFQGGITIFPASGDSLLTHDSGLQRLMLFSDEGAFGRVVASGPDLAGAFEWGPWVYRRAVVLGTRTGAARSCIVAALDVMPIPPPEAGMRLILVDELGRLWVREVAATGVQWTVWRRDGVLLGDAPMPERFDPAHIGADFVLGRGYAEDDTERIRILTVRDDRDPGSCLSETAVRRTEGQSAPAEITRTLRNLFTAQEAVYADKASYTDDPAALPIPIPEQVVVRFLRANTLGWAGAILDPLSEFGCAVSVGNNFPGGWIEGSLICG